MNSDANSLSSASANTDAPMDQRTLTALQGSIAKWQAIVDGTSPDMAADNCPLCKAFPACAGCPVAAKVHEDDCAFTPYMAWVDENDRLGIPFPFHVTPETLPFAQAELSFLQSLLPGASNG